MWEHLFCFLLGAEMLPIMSGKITYFIVTIGFQTREESASPEGEPILLAPFAPKQYNL
jgi:hypothetical protein